jgi:hypothetical protein
MLMVMFFRNVNKQMAGRRGLGVQFDLTDALRTTRVQGYSRPAAVVRVGIRILILLEVRECGV